MTGGAGGPAGGAKGSGGPAGGTGASGGGPGVVRAAGCVLWRRAPGSRVTPADATDPAAATDPATGPAGAADGAAVELCLIHRPKYDDWSFPKGKLKPGEDLLAAAVREVREETGHACRPGVRLGTVRYRVRERDKEVTYWAAEAGPGAFVPGKEVDALRWLPPGEARDLLSHPQDRPLVTWFLATL
ncbi:NUDIX hydrolase [Streptomyces sp. enrichment culture]|uniref:NUDIX hydrolase n=1 Tax=Streptomyces sp. enrichment culture TaxID=1795815 RepID=UPI003F55A341